MIKYLQQDVNHTWSPGLKIARKYNICYIGLEDTFNQYQSVYTIYITYISTKESFLSKEECTFPLHTIDESKKRLNHSIGWQ